MTSILIACGVGAATMALAVTVFVLGRRSGGAGEDRLAAMAAQADERMEAMVRDLSDALAVDSVTSFPRQAPGTVTSS